MWILIAIILCLTGLFAILIILDRRMRRLITDHVESTGGKLRSIKPTVNRRAEYYAVFVPRKGDLRRAVVRVKRGFVNIIEDQPYHRTIKRPTPIAPGSPPKITIDALEWAATLNIYPGHKDYQHLVLNLAAGPQHEIQIPETDDRFARLLQVFEVHSLGNDDSEWGALDLVVNNKPAKLTWRAEGIEPNRLLNVTVTPEQPH